MKTKHKNPHAVALGRKGGQAAKNLTAEHQRAAAISRWGKRPHCNCGAMTVDRAKKRNHKC